MAVLDPWLSMWEPVKQDSGEGFEVPGYEQIQSIAKACKAGDNNAINNFTVDPVLPMQNTTLQQDAPPQQQSYLRAAMTKEDTAAYRSKITNADKFWSDTVTDSFVSVNLDKKEWTPAPANDSQPETTTLHRTVEGRVTGRCLDMKLHTHSLQKDLGLLLGDYIEYSIDHNTAQVVKPSSLRSELHPCKLWNTKELQFASTVDINNVRAAIEEDHPGSVAECIVSKSIIKLHSPLHASRYLLGKLHVKGYDPPSYPTKNSYTLVPHDDSVPFIQVTSASLGTPDPATTYYAKLTEHKHGRWHGVVEQARKDVSVPAGIREVSCMKEPAPIESFPVGGGTGSGYRLDLTEHCFVFSIDRKGTLLYDDAFTVKKTLNKDGGTEYIVMVHIADPSELVEEGSDIDVYAEAKSCDVFLPDVKNGGESMGMVDRMLPDEITSRCSLSEGVPRHALTVLLRIGQNGDVLFTDLLKTTISNACCLYMTDDMTWRDFVNQQISDHNRVPLPPVVAHANVLHEAYLAASSKTMFLEEKTQGREGPSAVVQYFMIAAKRIAADTLSKKVPGIVYYVVNKPPDFKSSELTTKMKNVERAVDRLTGFTTKLDFTSETKLCASLEKLKQTVTNRVSYLGILRYLNMELSKRFNKESYTSPTEDGWPVAVEIPFTSPLRKYTDLQVVRMLSTGKGENCTVDGMVVIDEKGQRKRRLARKLKRFHFAFGLFYRGAPKRSILPCRNRCVMLTLSSRGDKMRIAIFDAVTEDVFHVNINEVSAFASHRVDPTGTAYVVWSGGPASEEEELIPFVTEFSAVLFSETGQQIADFKTDRKILRRSEEASYPPLPLQLGTDSPVDWIPHCPF